MCVSIGFECCQVKKKKPSTGQHEELGEGLKPCVPFPNNPELTSPGSDGELSNLGVM